MHAGVSVITIDAETLKSFHFLGNLSRSRHLRGNSSLKFMLLAVIYRISRCPVNTMGGCGARGAQILELLMGFDFKHFLLFGTSGFLCFRGFLLLYACF